MSSSDVNMQIDEKRVYGQTVCGKIAECIAKLGFPLELKLPSPEFDAAVFHLVVDPYTQSQDLTGYWYDTAKQRIGQIKFYGDGSFYAEYDVVQPHPTKKRWFVEAINAWGKLDNIKVEAKLLDIPQ
ncbi:hypothetical protein KEF85_01120 [Methylomonas paludis]|uniref:Uncharacterized protein n=1 Tax=Methylomonas paludis TaxID=1173101 RepID=A0A975MNZ7_9GAMM|nr:hypothetical protein [Methylomonas paludis]QWF71129.1 hypothetical protein KEF85_01120 [Methylomonas paludis]